MIPPGTTIGRYVVERQVAATATHALYRSRDPLTGNTVAIKVMLVASPSRAVRLHREAVALQRLDHAAVVRYLDSGQAADHGVFLAMEWLEGEDLKQRLARGPLTPDDAVVLGARLGAALGAAHRLGLVHRDLKPSNVFLPGGSLRDAKLIDFGVARADDATFDLTEPGNLVGTPNYMSPEQCRGHVVGPASDLFALGAVLFECLTGQRAFAGGNVHATFAKILFGAPLRPGDQIDGIPAALDALIAQLLERDPLDRPASAEAVLARLAAGRDLGATGDGVSRAERHVVTVLVVATEHALDALDTATTAAGGADDTARARPALAASATEVQAIGAALVGVFRDGAARDQSTRAAQTALTLRALGAGLRLHLATGHAVAPSGVPPDLVDLALAAAAPPDTIRVEAMTATLLEGRFTLARDGGDVTLVAERRIEQPRELLGRITPLVGRSAEWAALEPILDESIRHGEPRGAFVVGDAGQGKTRLLHELIERAAQRGVRVWSAGADAMQGGALDLLGRAIFAGLGATAPAQLIDALARHVPRDRAVEVVSLLAAVRAPPGAAAPTVRDADLLGDRIAATLIDWLAAEAAAAPIVLVLDDLHWGDAATVTAAARALRRVRAPLVVVAAARPPVGELVTPLWSSPRVQVIELGPLGRRSQHQLIREVLGRDVAGALADQMIELAQGNALHLEELIRHAAGGTPRALPVTLTAAIDVRLRALDDEDRRALRAASVLGTAFAAAAVTHVLGETDADAVARRLDRLVERELVSRLGAGGYAFRQPILREAAYAALADHDRRTGHRLAAEWLRDQPGVAARTIAEHLAIGDRRDAAASWYARAAESALVVSDYATALACARGGLAGAATGDTRLTLLLSEAEALQWRGDEPERAFAAAREARAEAAPGSLSWLRATRELAILARTVRDLEMLAAIPAELEAVVTDEPAMLLMAMAAVLIQLAYHGRGDEIPASSVALLDRLVERVEATDPRPVLWAEALWAVRTSDRPGRSLQHARRAVAMAERAESNRDLTWVMSNLGMYLVMCGGAAEAEPILRRALELTEQLELGPAATHTRQNLGVALWLLGKLDEADALLRRAAAEFERAANPVFQGSCCIYLGRVALARDDAAGARALAEHARTLGAGAPHIVALAEALLSRCARTSGSGDPHAHAAAAHALVTGEFPAANGFPEGEMGEMLIRATYVEELAAHGRLDEARQELGWAGAKIRARAASFDDPEARARFLAIEEHAALLRLEASLDHSQFASG